MENSFRRIAFAQGLLPHDAASAAPDRWTDEELSLLLQIDEPLERADQRLPPTLGTLGRASAGIGPRPA
jgi:hypothetical protein